MAITDQILNIGSGGYSGALSSIGNIAGSAGSIIKKVKALNSKEMSVGAIRDYNTNGFLAQDSQFVPEFFTRAFDEPTYLSFRIEFMINDPDNISRNIAFNNHGLVNDSIKSALFNKMYDYMPEPFLDDFNLIKLDGMTGTSDIDSSVGMRYSTENYLDVNLGDHGRATLLHNFKRALQDIQDNFPYYFTSISGIDSLTSVNPEEGIRVKDGVITLECMEGIDLRITQLLQMYRKIVWDDVYQRWALPDMMRYFGMRIYISEIRLFSDTKRENDQTPPVYSFEYSQKRNETYKWQNAGKDTMDKINGIASGLTSATAVSQQYLGTKSIITKALNYTSGTVNTALGAYNSIAGALNDLQYCNNAINEVMPTICFECHMCEFDISDTFSHISELSSNTHDTQSPRPKMKIKVGQVREKQSYPLNKELSANSSGYYKTINDYKGGSRYNESDLTNATSFADLYKQRTDNVGFSGNFINDDVLISKYQNRTLGTRQREYIENLAHSVGDTKGLTISEKRMPSKLINDSDKMTYNPGNITQSAAQASLFSTVMNEAVSIATHAGVGSDVIGTKSTATDPQSEQVDAMKAIGEMMNAAVEKIYNGPEMKSMAAQGVPDSIRAQIAAQSFGAYIDALELSTATSDSPLRDFLKSYRIIQSQEQ